MNFLAGTISLDIPAEAGTHDCDDALVGPGFRRGDGIKGKYAR
jgi:hypothetical protein